MHFIKLSCNTCYQEEKTPWARSSNFHFWMLLLSSRLVFFVIHTAPVAQLTRSHLCGRGFNSCGNGAPLVLCEKRIHICPGCGSHTCCIRKDRGTHDSPCGWCTSHDPRKELYSVRTCKLLLAPHCW